MKKTPPKKKRVVKQTKIEEAPAVPTETLNTAALRPLYETLRECSDSLLHNEGLSKRIASSLALAETKA